MAQQRRWIHGKTVENGKLRFLSASSLQLGDMGSSTGCLRRWFYSYLKGIKEPPSDAMDAGAALHEEIATYLKTGERALSQQVLAGLHMIPEPGLDLLVEHDMIPPMPDGSSGLELASVRAAGVPVLGAIDLLHARGTNKGVSDIEDVQDPEGTVEVIDWKTARTLDWAKTGPELLSSIQMTIYGKYVFEAAPKTTFVRLSHGYFPSRGIPQKRTIRVDRDQIENSWKRVEGIAVEIRDVAAATDVDKVPANTQACRSYGRDCPARSICKAANVNSLSQYIGRTAAEEMILKANQAVETTMSTPVIGLVVPIQDKMNTPVIAPNSLLAKFQAQKAAKSNGETTLEDERAKLKAQENAAKHLALFQLVQAIESYGLGFPQLNGAAAQAVVDAKRAQGIQIDYQGNGLGGTGELAMDSVSDPEDLKVVFEEVKAIIAQRAREQAATATTSPPVLIPLDAPVSVPVTMGTSDAVEIITEVKKPPRKPATKKVSKAIDVVGIVTNITSPVTSSTSTMVDAGYVVEIQPSVSNSTAINLYVDCIVSGMQTESMWPLVHRLIEIMNAQSGKPDFRLAAEDDALGYAKWRGALAALLRQTPIPPGNYILDGSFGEIGRVVAETMRDIVERSGGVFVKGVR